MLRPDSHGCDSLQQLDKDKKRQKKKKIPDHSDQFGQDPRPTCSFAIHEGLTVSNANLRPFQARVSKKHVSTRKNDTRRMKDSNQFPDLGLS